MLKAVVVLARKWGGEGREDFLGHPENTHPQTSCAFGQHEV